MFGSAESEHPRLTNGEIIHQSTIQQRYTDGQMTCDSITALCIRMHSAVNIHCISHIQNGLQSFPGWLLSRIGRFPERRFPGGHFQGKTFPGWSFSRIRQFLMINLQAHT